MPLLKAWAPALSQIVGAEAAPALAENARAELAALVGGAAAREESERVLKQVAEALFKLASLDFSSHHQVRGDGSMFDAVAGSLNMLSEELRSHLEERTRVERDLEDRVRARTADLEASSERYRTLVESTNAIPWEADAATLTVTYISPQIEKLLGAPAQGMVGSKLLGRRVHADDRERVMRKLVALSQSTDGNAELDYRVARADGRVVFVRSVVAARPGREGAVVLRGITFDVTEQKRLEGELSQAQKLESVGRLASGIAHEINTPIQFVSDSVHFVRDAIGTFAAVIGEYETLAHELQADPRWAERAARIVEKAEEQDIPCLLINVPAATARCLEGIGRVTTIVRSMKDFAHPDMKEMVPQDLNRAIESTLAIARNEYKYVADLETNLADIPPVVCHLGELNQVVLNLVVNAAHAIGDVVRGTADRGAIRVATRRDGDHVVLTLGDTGGGIPPAVRDRIFEPFFTTKEVGRGTGQGLAIARAVVVEKHRGTLTFVTEMGKGTTFTIRLPIAGAGAVSVAA